MHASILEVNILERVFTEHASLTSEGFNMNGPLLRKRIGPICSYISWKRK